MYTGEIYQGCTLHIYSHICDTDARSLFPAAKNRVNRIYSQYKVDQGDTHKTVKSLYKVMATIIGLSTLFFGAIIATAAFSYQKKIFLLSLGAYGLTTSAGAIFAIKKHCDFNKRVDRADREVHRHLADDEFQEILKEQQKWVCEQFLELQSNGYSNKIQLRYVLKVHQATSYVIKRHQARGEMHNVDTSFSGGALSRDHIENFLSAIPEDERKAPTDDELARLFPIVV